MSEQDDTTNPLAGLVCEVCGKPATSLVRDTRETDPVRGKGGRWFSCSDVESEHAYCRAHDRTPRMKRRFRNQEDFDQWVEAQEDREAKA